MHRDASPRSDCHTHWILLNGGARCDIRLVQLHGIQVFGVEFEYAKWACGGALSWVRSSNILLHLPVDRNGCFLFHIEGHGQLHP